MKGKKVIAVVLALAITGGAVCGGVYAYKNYQDEKLVAEVQPVSYINMGYWGDQETSYGMVTNDSSQEIYLENDSKVEQVYVTQGDEVKAGDPLLKYDTSEVELEIKRKKLDISTTENAVSKAQRALEELKQTKPVDKTRPRSSETDYYEKRKQELEKKVSLPETDEKDSRIYNYITVSSVPYNKKEADGSEENPYIYYVNKGAYAYGSFFNSLRPSGDGEEGKCAVFIICKKDSAGKMVMEYSAMEETTETTEGVENIVYESQTPAPDDSVSPNIKRVNGSSLTRYDDDSMWYIFSGEEVDTSLQDLLDSIEDEEEEDEWVEPEGYTETELAEAIAEKEREIKELDIKLRKERLELEAMENTASDGVVYAKIDGTVKYVRDTSDSGSEENEGSAFIELLGSGGLYVSGTISELLLDEVKPGTVITANSWETGNTFEATVTEISNYPVSGNSMGDGNPNVSYYSYTAYIEDSSALKNGEYVDLSIQTNTSDTNGLYIESAYVRQEDGRSYVMIADENDRLKKQYVVTGKTVYGTAIEIKSGLSESDRIAFPYGKTAVEGIRVIEEESMIY